MKTADFDFPLPEDSIASRPCERRDHSRLLVLNGDGSVEHRRFFQIPEYLSTGDMLLVNNTKVLPARLFGRKKSGGKLDILLLRPVGDGLTWQVLVRGTYEGRLTVAGAVEADLWSEEVSAQNGAPRPGTPRTRYLRFANTRAAQIEEFLERYGSMPLPPYIKRPPDQDDKTAYQTVYAESKGSIAAPTAGLHFTASLLQSIHDKGVLIRKITLHVGPGTFRPITTDMLSDHRMDLEHFEFDSSLVSEMEQVKESGRRIVAVGTTTTRAIEGFLSGAYRSSGNGHTLVPVSGNGRVKGSTDVFIHPGYAFKAVDSLITNFHLPRSTPLMLVAALAGRIRMLDAYREAIAMGYRFFSYGDAMLIL